MKEKKQKEDFVNMAMAQHANAAALLVVCGGHVENVLDVEGIIIGGSLMASTDVLVIVRLLSKAGVGDSP